MWSAGSTEGTEIRRQRQGGLRPRFFRAHPRIYVFMLPRPLRGLDISLLPDNVLLRLKIEALECKYDEQFPSTPFGWALGMDKPGGVGYV